MSEALPPYPPPQHLLRDLGIVVERDEAGATGRLDVLPTMHDEVGRVRVGVLATLVDVVAGETAIRAVAPQWIATSDLAVHVDRLPSTGTIEVRAHVLRRGRQTVVLEAPFRERASGVTIGLATLGFAVLPARNEIQKSSHWAEAPIPRTAFALPDSGLRKPLLDSLGIEVESRQPGLCRLALRSYVVNSLGAIQGGAMAILIESTADRFGRASLGRPTHVQGLAIHYLKLARVGPVRAEARTIARTGSGLVVRVELRDEGLADELLTVATVHLETAPSREAP